MKIEIYMEVVTAVLNSFNYRITELEKRKEGYEKKK